MLFTSVHQTIKGLLPAAFDGNDRQTSYIAFVIAVIIWVMLVLFVAKYLWNTVLVKLVTVVNPSTSMFQMLGYMVLLQIMLPQ
jgi:hypothetical protein